MIYCLEKRNEQFFHVPKEIVIKINSTPTNDKTINTNSTAKKKKTLCKHLK